MQMDIDALKVYQVNDSRTVLKCNGDYVVSTTFDTTENLCRVELRSSELGGPLKLLREWQVAGASDIGDIVAVDQKTQTVFAAHKNSSNVSILFSDKGVHSVRKLTPIPFKSKIKDIVRVDASETNQSTDAMVVLSETSEIAVLRFDSSTVRCKHLMLSFSSPLAFVSKRPRSTLVLACTSSARIELRVVLLECSSSSEYKVHEHPVIRLPVLQLSKQNEREVTRPPGVLGCTIQPQSIFVLYETGELHAIRCTKYSALKHSGTLNGWWDDHVRMPHEQKPVVIDSPTAIFNLLSGPVTHQRNVDHGSNGGICALGDSYVVVAYARYSSIWDAAYHTDHGFVELDNVVQSVCASTEMGVVYLESDSTIHSLEFDLIANGGSLSLANAVKRKGSCARIVTGNSGPVKDTLLSAQPVSVSSMKTAANAGKNFSQLYEKHLLSAKEIDQQHMNRVLNRRITSDASVLQKLNESFVRNSDSRIQGDSSNPSDLGLTMLPSEQVAAVTVARCLVEITEGKVEFVAPLIDIVSTGSVSFETVMQVLAPVFSEFGVKVPSLTSMAAYLSRFETMYALEAVVSGVTDLPESELVRAAQFANRMYEVHRSKRSTLRKQGKKVNKRDMEKVKELGRKSRRVLLKCIVARADRAKLMESFRKIRQEDVKSLLTYFSEVIYSYQTRKDNPFPSRKPNAKSGTKPRTKAASIAYRGIGNWLDWSQLVGEGEHVEVLELKGCMEWTCMLLDAHFSSLLFDDKCRSLIQKLLVCVTEQRRVSESMAPLLGGLEHIQAKLPVPSFKPLYEVFKVELGTSRVYR